MQRAHTQVSALLVACTGITSGSGADDDWTGLYNRIQRVLQGCPKQIATCFDGKPSSVTTQNKDWHSYTQDMALLLVVAEYGGMCLTVKCEGGGFHSHHLQE